MTLGAYSQVGYETQTRKIMIEVQARYRTPPPSVPNKNHPNGRGSREFFKTPPRV